MFKKNLFKILPFLLSTSLLFAPEAQNGLTSAVVAKFNEGFSSFKLGYKNLEYRFGLQALGSKLISYGVAACEYTIAERINNAVVEKFSTEDSSQLKVTILGFAASAGFMLFSYQAKNILFKISPWHKQLTLEDKPQSIVDQICKEKNISTVNVYVKEDQELNAWVAANRSIVVTTGLLKKIIDEEELKALFGHEIGHIAHKDLIVINCMFAAIFAMDGIVNRTICAKNIPIKFIKKCVRNIFVQAGFLGVMKYSRRAEFAADKFSAQVTGKPELTIEVLKKIDPFAMSVSINPQNALGVLSALRRTHPPTYDRILALKALCGASTAL